MVTKNIFHLISSTLFLSCLFLIPFFNDVPFLPSSLRTPSNILGILLFLSLIFHKEISIKTKDACLLVALIILVLITISVNLNQSGGITSISGERLDIAMFFAGGRLVLCFMVLFSFIYIIPNVTALKIINVATYAFILTSIYCVLEMLTYIFNVFPESIMNHIEQFTHARQRDWGAGRVRGFTFEPSYLVPILFFFLPFLIARKNRFLLVIWGVIGVATGSPTFIIALSVFWLFFYLKNAYVYTAIIFITVITVTTVVMQEEVYNLVNNIPWEIMPSVTTRLGSLVSGISLIIENPFFGQGPVSQGYFIAYNYPDFFYSTHLGETWYNLAFYHFKGATFSAIITYASSFGLISLIIVFYIGQKGITKLGLASSFALIISSFGVESYISLVFWLFLAFGPSGFWRNLDQIYKT